MVFDGYPELRVQCHDHLPMNGARDRIARIDAFVRLPADAFEQVTDVQGRSSSWAGEHEQYTISNAATDHHPSTKVTRLTDDDLSFRAPQRRLRCPLCKRTVRGDRSKYDWAFDQLLAVAPGEPVELRVLAAMLSKQ